MKKIRMINKFIIIVSLMLDLIYLIGTIFGCFNSNILVCIALVPILFLPMLIRKTLKIEISYSFELMYLIFVFLAQVLGSIMEFYALIYWYDSLAHLLSGIFGTFLAFELLKRFKIYKKENNAFNTLFMIAINMMIASLWEIFEFTADKLLGGDAQRVMLTGVQDTMKDMICALLGGIIFILIYNYRKNHDLK